MTPHGGTSYHITLLLSVSGLGCSSPIVVASALQLRLTVKSPAVPLIRWDLPINLFIFPKTQAQLQRRTSTFYRTTLSCVGFIRESRRGLEIHKEGIILRGNLSGLRVTPYKTGVGIHVARLDRRVAVNPMLIRKATRSNSCTGRIFLAAGLSIIHGGKELVHFVLECPWVVKLGHVTASRRPHVTRSMRMW